MPQPDFDPQPDDVAAAAWRWFLALAMAALLVTLAWLAAAGLEAWEPQPIATPTGFAQAVGP